MALKFFAPDGNDRVGISPEEIASLILEGDPEFWEAGSGDGAIRFSDESADGEMIIMVREPYGVFVQFTEAETGKEWVLSTGADEEETITISQNREPWELPHAFFVPRGIAARTVSEFARTGKRPEDENWSEF